MLKVALNTNQVSLWQFKMVINTGELRYLLVLDSYDELPDYDLDELAVTWHSIYEEFSETVGGNRSELWLSKQKQLVSLKLNYERHGTMLRVVQILPHPEFIEMINEDGYEIDLDDFERTFQKARSRVMKMKGKITMLENEQKTEVKKDDLDQLITTLEKFQGYQFNEETMSVKKFANIYKNYKDAGQQDRV